MAETSLPAARHEARDVGALAIAIGLGALLAGLVLLGLVTVWLFPSSATDRTMRLPLPVYPAPRLQADPSADLNAFRNQQLAALHGVYWIDHAHGVVHIPIDDAMREIAARGIPDWPSSSRAQP